MNGAFVNEDGIDVPAALDCLERALQLAPEKSDVADRAGDLRLRMQQKRVTAAQNKSDDAAAELLRQPLLFFVAELHRRQAMLDRSSRIPELGKFTPM